MGGESGRYWDHAALKEFLLWFTDISHPTARSPTGGAYYWDGNRVSSTEGTLNDRAHSRPHANGKPKDGFWSLDMYVNGTRYKMDKVNGQRRDEVDGNPIMFR